MRAFIQTIWLTILCLVGSAFSLTHVFNQSVKTLSELIVNNQAQIEAQQKLLLERLEQLLGRNESEAFEDPKLVNITNSTVVGVNWKDTDKEFASTSNASSTAPKALEETNISGFIEEMIEEKIKSSVSSNLKELFSKMGHGEVSIDSLFPKSWFSNNNTEHEAIAVSQEENTKKTAIARRETPSLKGARQQVEEDSSYFIPGIFPEDQLFLIDERSVYPLHKIGTQKKGQGLQYITGKDIKIIITSCKFVSISWASDLVKATNAVYKILLISGPADTRFKRNIILTESKLINSYSNCDLLMGKQPKKYSKNLNFRFPQTSRATLSMYKGYSLISIKKRQIKRLELLRTLEAFISSVKKYNHLNLCSAAGFDSARESLLNILLNYHHIVRIDIKRLEVALIKAAR